MPFEATFDEVKTARKTAAGLLKRHAISARSTSDQLGDERSSAAKSLHQEEVDIAKVSLTRGQVNAVRRRKAGITPSRIARQFGISQSNVRKALASDKPKP